MSDLNNGPKLFINVNKSRESSRKARFKIFPFNSLALFAFSCCQMFPIIQLFKLFLQAVVASKNFS